MGRLRAAAPILLGVLAALASASAGVEVAYAAPSAPSVYTGEASSVAQSTVTLKASVDPRNQQTEGYFQYGLTAAYEAQTPVAGIGTGFQTVHIAVPITGLVANTTYHYRFVAVNATGTTVGQDRGFTTKKIPFSFKLAPPSQQIFGTPFGLTGTLSGTGSANHAVVLEANAFPFLRGFKVLGGPVLSDASGNFAFPPVQLLQSTQLRVSTVEKPPVISSVVLERVAIRVTLHVHSAGRAGYVRLYGELSPAQSLALVDFQLLRPGRRPVSVGSVVVRGRAHGASSFSRVLRIRRAGLYRAYVQSSGATVSNHSRAVAIR